MNKYDKRIAKYAKKMVNNTEEGGILSNFRTARYFVRCSLYGRHEEILRFMLNKYKKEDK